VYLTNLPFARRARNSYSGLKATVNPKVMPSQPFNIPYEHPNAAVIRRFYAALNQGT